MKHSMKMMWGCAGFVVLAIVLAASGVKGAYLTLLAVPCMLMMGAMVWMMARGSGGGSHGTGSK